MPAIGQLRPPAGFNWRPFVVPCEVGDAFVGNVSTESLQPDIKDGATYWVDPVAGSEANDGRSPATPFQKLATAMAKTDAGIIRWAEPDPSDPFTYRLSSWAASPATTKPGLIIKPWGLREGRPSSTALEQHNGAGWSLDGTYPNLYKRTRSLVADVRDTRAHEVSGAYKRYQAVSSLEESNDIEGSWILVGDVLYVHVLGGGAPTKEVLVAIAEANGIITTASKPVWCQGVDFMFGTRPFWIRNTLGLVMARHVFKDASFQYGTDQGFGNGIDIDGASEVLIDGSVFKHNLRDGANYDTLNGITPRVIELNCEGAWNGNQLVSDGNNNGSSGHGASVLVRAGGHYHHNDGPNMPDTGGCPSWNVGVYTHDSRRSSSITKADFYNSGGRMWLYKCRSDGGSAHSLTTTSGGITYLDECDLSLPLTDSGGVHQSYEQLFDYGTGRSSAPAMSNGYRHGNWLVACQRCGRTMYASESHRDWTGLIVCRSDLDERNQQDFKRGQKDVQRPPFVSPEPEGVFLLPNEVTEADL